MIDRSIQMLLPADQERVGNTQILRALPMRRLRQVAPYILLDHFGPETQVPGDTFYVPPHPHAGIQTITYFLRGGGLHRDSLGSHQAIDTGDLAIMSSGRGIVHSEAAHPRIQAEGGVLEGFQIWANLPARHKFDAPRFDFWAAEALPSLSFGEGLRLKVLIGDYGGLHSPVGTYVGQFLYHLHFAQAGTMLLDLPAGYTAAAYSAGGRVRIGEAQALERGEIASFAPGAGGLSLSSEGEADVLLMGGEDLGEKSVSYGPFVMNSLEEVQRVIRDYEQGAMGTLAY